jgi:hypothetical protein
MIDTDRPIQVPSSELPWPIAMAEISRHLRRGLVQRSDVVILAALALAAVDAFDLSFAVRTGRARGRYGTVTRKGQPRRFWRYVYGGYAVLLLCAGVILWALISPDSF